MSKEKPRNDQLPLASELLDPILEQLRDQDKKFSPPRGGENFEQWLSRLAEGQPYLSADQNLERSASFVKISRQIAEIISERERKALNQPIPDWFADLLVAWHVRQATVISFNYDNLIECGVNSQHLNMFGPYPISVHDVLRRLPPLPPSQRERESRISNIQGGGAVSLSGDSWIQDEPCEETFRLIKLHGSISWYWVPDDMTGSTLQRWAEVGSFEHPLGDQRTSIRRQLPGREPFIAPPSSTKSRYLANPVIRQLWIDAHEALANAERVYFLGYSIPLQDQAAMALFRETLGDREVEICIADIRAGNVESRLTELLLGTSSASTEAAKIPAHRRDPDDSSPGLRSKYRGTNFDNITAIEKLQDTYLKELIADCANGLIEFAKRGLLGRIEEGQPSSTDTNWIDGPVNIWRRSGLNNILVDAENSQTKEDGTLVIRGKLGQGIGEHDLRPFFKLFDSSPTAVTLELDDGQGDIADPAPVVAYQLVPASNGATFGYQKGRSFLVLTTSERRAPTQPSSVAEEFKYLS
ncbi:hypothetical protein [Ferrimicrobium sp.]|uniref:hypothetical protein n=1 Tax=Ferrimicrobium sp. TaxID=2926050 RepID=UPI002612C2C3|nr:hypothetical protein [Ferrimicrobium sp.]